MTTTRTLRAFHDDPATKRRYLDRVRAHREADEIVQGTYWAGGRGCAVGCTIHGDDHTAYEQELGIPTILAHLEDRIFEGLPAEEARAWPEQFLAAIPVGADLSRVAPRVLLAMQRRNRVRVEEVANIHDALRTQVLAAIDGVLATLTGWVATGEAGTAETARSAAAAAGAARSAAWSAAEAARAWAWSESEAAEAAAAAANAAGAAAGAEAAAESAAWAAVWSARAAEAAAEAEAAEYRMMADDLLRALAAAPVDT